MSNILKHCKGSIYISIIIYLNQSMFGALQKLVLKDVMYYFIILIICCVKGEGLQAWGPNCNTSLSIWLWIEPLFSQSCIFHWVIKAHGMSAFKRLITNQSILTPPRVSVQKSVRKAFNKSKMCMNVDAPPGVNTLHMIWYTKYPYLF